MTRSGLIGAEFGEGERILEREREKKRREREKRKFLGLFEFFKTRFYTSLSFLKRNFVFVYFCSCLQFLTNTTLK